ncbi:MAG TPA: OmpA family protein [Methylomirabilota bacterium]|jgi:outer membrane protein OmpA-like peptidoglycan-associated protein|nr:OmpA family protein [Methylomirabilota bacterium]
MARRATTTHASQPVQRLGDLRAQETDRGLVVTLGDVSFESGQAKLTAEAMRKLYNLAAVLKDNPQQNILIEGYTDNTGSEAANLELSRQRADAVRDFLIANGVDPEQVMARGYGEAYPVASNTTETGRRENRRVEIVILPEGTRATERLAAERR